MREPAPDYSCRQYERPGHTWVCGLASDGPACPAGPTPGGYCPALAECVPRREGDRWECNRSQLRGGVCEEGPTPEGECRRVNRCRPLRSLRAARGRFVAACMLLATGALLIVLSADWRDEAISAGPLARHHAQLLEGGGSNSNCAACHAAAERSAAGWAASLALGHGERASQSQRCMECHDKTIDHLFALAAHNLPPDALRLLREDTNGRNTAIADQKLACATCHREHRGAEFDMTAMDNAACQSCHQQRYESFATDHPDFGAWPYLRRTRIAFDHASHQSKHFADIGRAFDCRACHFDDATGQVQLTASYEAACASCHDERIATSLAQGVPMLALPTLDVDALRARGHDIGDWPEQAIGDFDGRLPPVVVLLLAADPDARPALASLAPHYDLFDVDPENPEQLEAAATLAMSINKLFADLSHSGPTAAGERLRLALGNEGAGAPVAALFAGLSVDTIHSAAAEWLGVSPATGATWKGETPANASSPAPRPIRFDPAGGWLRDDATLSIRYHPAAHADPVLAGWLETLAASPQLAEQPLALAMFKEISKPIAPGLCTSCHTVEQTPTGRLAINWRAHDRTTEPRGFTKFSHGPHLLLPQLADCTSCHSIELQRSTVATASTDWDPHHFPSDFAPLSKHQCAQCHTAKAAGDKCQSCHNYHVDQIESWRLRRFADFVLPIAD